MAWNAWSPKLHSIQVLRARSTYLPNTKTFYTRPISGLSDSWCGWLVDGLGLIIFMLVCKVNGSYYIFGMLYYKQTVFY